MKKSSSRIAACTLLLATITSLVTAASAADRRQLDSHEHGVTALNIALENQLVVIELEGPAMNFVGFEHPARTAEQKQAVAEALELLRGEPSLISLDADAACTRTEVAVEHVSDADHHDSDHSDHSDDSEHGDHSDHEGDSDHADHDGDSHAEFVGQYQYRCESPDKLAEIRVGLFERFPLTSEVEVSFVGPRTQTFKNLTPADPVLKVQP